MNASPQFPAWAACEIAAQAAPAAPTIPPPPLTPPAPPQQSFTNCNTPLAPGAQWATQADFYNWAACQTAAFNATNAATSALVQTSTPVLQTSPATLPVQPVSSNPQPGTIASTFPAVGYIDPQGNLWALGASGQVGGPDAVNLGAISSTTLTSATSQTLATALQGNTSNQNGYLLLNSTAMSAVESAYGMGGTAGMSTSTLLLIAAGTAAVFMMSR